MLEEAGKGVIGKAISICITHLRKRAIQSALHVHSWMLCIIKNDKS